MKKVWSLLLALLMVMSILPTGVLSADAATLYTVRIETQGSGRVEALTAAEEGAYVTVTMTAEEGWFVREMAVETADGRLNTISYNSPTFKTDTDGFTMPAKDVTLRVTFAKPENFSDSPQEPTVHESGEPCTVTFDPHGGEGSMERPTVEYGESYTLPDCEYTKEGREFYKWEIGGTEYDAGDSITVTSDITVKTIWQYKTIYRVDNSLDRSTTEVVGVLRLTDLRTGETADYTVTDETASSEFTQPSNPTVSAMIEEAKDALNDRLDSYENVQDDSMTVSYPSIIETRDDRVFTSFDDGGYDQNGDYYTGCMVTDGSYYHRWQITVTCEAQYTSIPKSYIHVLSTEGGSVDFWCEEYNGSYEQPYAVPEGARVNLMAVPENGYVFKGWYKGNVDASSYDEMFTDELITTENPYVFEAYGYPYVCAVFEYTGVVYPQGDQIQVWITDGGKAAVEYTPSVTGHPYIKPMDGTDYVSIGEVVQFWKGDEITVYQQPDDGYVFKGWYHVRIEWGPGDALPKFIGDAISTEPTFTYKPGVTVVDGDEEPLRYVCAVFEEESTDETFTVSFDPHGGEGEMAPVTVNKNESFTLPACGFTKTERVFYKWQIDGTLFDAGDTITLTGDATVTALWKYAYASSKLVNVTVDASTTNYVGVLVLKDTRSGKTVTKEIYSETVASAYSAPQNSDVETLAGDCSTALMAAANSYPAVQSVSDDKPALDAEGAEIIDSWNRIVFRYDETPDNDGDYMPLMIMEGDYGRQWRFTETVTVEFTSDLLGDADGDGVVSVLDATAIQKKLASIEISPFNETAACVSGEKLSVMDATYIQKWLAHIEVPYAVGEPII